MPQTIGLDPQQV
jgi:hypothetical protein